MNNLYKDNVINHFRNPRNRGHLPEPDFISTQLNPSCGDSISFEGCLVDNRLTQLRFSGSGCVISQAMASMLAESSTGKLANDVLGYDKEAVLSLIGIDLGPTRLKCALLPLQALQEGIVQWKLQGRKIF